MQHLRERFGELQGKQFGEHHVMFCDDFSYTDPVDHSIATFWYVLPSLPMFLLVPVLMKRGIAFGPALLAGCLLTVGLYLLMTMALGRFGIRL